MIGTLELAKALHEARRESLLKNGFRFSEFDKLAPIDRDVLYAQAVALLEVFIITPKLEVSQ